MTPIAQIQAHVACIITKRLAGKDVSFHYKGIARAAQQMAAH